MDEEGFEIARQVFEDSMAIEGFAMIQENTEALKMAIDAYDHHMRAKFVKEWQLHPARMHR